MTSRYPFEWLHQLFCEDLGLVSYWVVDRNRSLDDTVDLLLAAVEGRDIPESTDIRRKMATKWHEDGAYR